MEIEKWTNNDSEVETLEFFLLFVSQPFDKYFVFYFHTNENVRLIISTLWVENYFHIR